jgi:hypothetical protein
MNGSTFEEALKDRGFSVSDGSRYEPVAEPLDTRRVVTAVNTLIGGIAVRAVIYELGPTRFEYEIRIDGHVTPDSPVRGFPTAWEAVQAAKVDLGRWVLEVLERA